MNAKRDTEQESRSIRRSRREKKLIFFLQFLIFFHANGPFRPPLSPGEAETMRENMKQLWNCESFGGARTECLQWKDFNEPEN